MKKIKYVMTYPDGKFVAVDTASGYPYANDYYPMIWFELKEVEEYQAMFPKEGFVIREMEHSLKEHGVTKEIEVFVDAVDFRHEIGEGNAPGPHYIYNSIKEIKEKQPCVEQCGIIRAKLVAMESVQDSDYSDIENRKHNMPLSEKYMLMKIALNKISNFTHKEECSSKEAPIYECGCYNKSQWELADEVLEKIKND